MCFGREVDWKQWGSVRLADLLTINENKKKWSFENVVVL